VSIFALPVTQGPLRVIASRTARATQPLTADEQARWQQLQHANPKYFDGAILSTQLLPQGDNTIRAEVDRYARFAAQASPAGTPASITRLLSVTGVLLASDASGREHVLLGRRSPHVSCYATMWELGPSGGLDVPLALHAEAQTVTSTSAPTLTLAEPDIAQHLAREIAEEVGDSSLLARARASSIAILRDDEARSDDIVMLVHLAQDAHALMATLAPASWEYTELRLLPTDTLHEFDTQHASEIIPPTRALFRALGWLTRE
jgi:hypothetical protein